MEHDTPNGTTCEGCGFAGENERFCAGQSRGASSNGLDGRVPVRPPWQRLRVAGMRLRWTGYRHDSRVPSRGWLRPLAVEPVPIDEKLQDYGNGPESLRVVPHTIPESIVSETGSHIES